MDNLINLFKVLSDETRLRILILLYHRSLCVCQMQAILEEQQPKISKHLGKLRDMGFVKYKRQEQLIYYYLDDTNSVLADALQMIVCNMKDDIGFKRDLERLDKVEEYLQVQNLQL
ncbi:MAG: transcriptional regulator [Firmicutes bacterium HGW-Firmicutes-1]|jgi:ArsR family transcriptional regulator|nr:MAG: transcriptional regulator [Firmicutes bacterium HGW-Firmicutes-1]